MLNFKSNTKCYSFKQPQGDFDHNSETNKSYKDNHASRPVIHKLKDHSVDVQPEGSLAKKYVFTLVWGQSWHELAFAFSYTYICLASFFVPNKTLHQI